MLILWCWGWIYMECLLYWLKCWMCWLLMGWWIKVICVKLWLILWCLRNIGEVLKIEWWFGWEMVIMLWYFGFMLWFSLNLSLSLFVFLNWGCLFYLFCGYRIRVCGLLWLKMCIWWLMVWIVLWLIFGFLWVILMRLSGDDFCFYIKWMLCWCL